MGYLLQYVESFFKAPIADYSLPITSIKEWFEKDEVEGKRNRIAKLIRDLAKEQNPGKQFSYPDLNFFNDDHADDSDDDDDEDYDGDNLRPQQHPSLQLVPNNLMRISAGNNKLVMTPAKPQGKVLIQRTGNQIKMSQYTSAGLQGVPAGVTVTPAPAKLLAGNNISIRKISIGSSSSVGESVQTSPDSTSQEDAMVESVVDRDREDVHHDQDRGGNMPDSQSFEQGTSKRAAEMGGFDGGAKRVKSDTDT